MYRFKFPEFLLNNKTSVAEMAKKLKMPYRSVQKMSERGTVKLTFVRNLETHYGDCSKYIIKD